MLPSPPAVAAAALLALAGAALCPGALHGQQDGARAIDPERLPRPEATAVKATSRIRVDGRLDEAAWRAAVPITEFIQAQPTTGVPATERTEVFLLYDAGHLYVGAICYDSDPRALTIKTIERDYPNVLSEDMDAFGVAFDTFLDRRNSFLFFVNPRGGIKDGQTFNDGTSRDYGWDGVVDVKTTVHDSGWTVEMAIPWSTLRFDPTKPVQSWGANFSRRIRRKNEVSYWAPLARRDRIFLMSASGTVVDLPQLPRGHAVWVKPFVLARRSEDGSLAPSQASYKGDGGADVKIGMTPRTTLDLTYRTDFSDADVDQEQVNLTRFPLFFPEQRDFFLENSGTFNFGDVTEPGAPRSGTSLHDFTLFHSRTIGLSNGTPVPLFGGGRLTGRAAAFEFGALDVQAEPFQGAPAENFSVLRLRGNFLDNSDAGVLVTNRQATGDTSGAYNRAVGVDLNMRVARFLFISSYAALTRGPGAGGAAGRVALGWRDRLWDASAMVRDIADDFDPGMGFISRTGIRQWYATVGAHPRVPVSGVLEINPYGEADYITDLAGNRVTWNGALGFGTTFRDGGVLALRYADRRELLEQPFEVRPGIALPPGDYHFQESSASYASSKGRGVFGSLGVSGGGYYGGSRLTVTGSASWQPDYHLTLDASATHNAVAVGDTSFSADLYAARLEYAFSTTLYFNVFVQYNADANQVITNARLNVIHAPLSHFYLVLTERRDWVTKAVLERFVTAKLTKLFAF